MKVRHWCKIDKIDDFIKTLSRRGRVMGTVEKSNPVVGVVELMLSSED